MPPDPRQCLGRPALCERCHAVLAIDPAGPWCRSCRTAEVGARRWAACPMPAVATGATVRTRGLRLCRAHARRMANRAGPHSAVPDPAPEPQRR
jgi:hypothetical protein